MGNRKNENRTTEQLINYNTTKLKNKKKNEKNNTLKNENMKTG